MRALILLESAVVLALALGILFRGPGREAQADVFRAERLLADAEPGERAEYRGDDGLTLLYEIRQASRGPRGVSFVLGLQHRDAGGPLPGVPETYEHALVRHGFFPVLAPSHPEADDRLWVWRRIRRETISVGGRPLATWRMDCIDPALPADQDAVVVHLHEDAPVFGIVRWTRNGRTYDLTTPWKPR